MARHQHRDRIISARSPYCSCHLTCFFYVSFCQFKSYILVTVCSPVRDRRKDIPYPPLEISSRLGRTDVYIKSLTLLCKVFLKLDKCLDKLARQEGYIIRTILIFRSSTLTELALIIQYSEIIGTILSENILRSCSIMMKLDFTYMIFPSIDCKYTTLERNKADIKPLECRCKYIEECCIIIALSVSEV